MPLSLILCTFDCDATILIYRNVMSSSGGGVKVTYMNNVYVDAISIACILDFKKYFTGKFITKKKKINFKLFITPQRGDKSLVGGFSKLVVSVTKTL